jgi:nucleoside-diphosphate-sugar epimerase
MWMGRYAWSKRRGKLVCGAFSMQHRRPVADVVDLYMMLLELPDERMAGQIYNAGYQNQTIAELAGIVRDVVQQEVPGREDIELVTTPSDDIRSYHISSEKITRDLGFVPKHTIEDAVRDLIVAFRAGKIPNSMTDIGYYNIKTMQRLQLK